MSKSISFAPTSTIGPMLFATILIVWGTLFEVPTILIYKGRDISPNFFVINVTVTTVFPFFSITPLSWSTWYSAKTLLSSV